MRAQTRHQLKQDRFRGATIGAAEATVHWSVEHKAKLAIAAIVILIVLAGAIGGWYYINKQDEKASADLSRAVRTLDTPLRPAGVAAQPDSPSFASAQERATEARKQFQAIVEEYPHTRSGDIARYFFGLTSAQLGDNATTERELRRVASTHNADLSALAKFALASVYRNLNRNKEAIDLYKQLIDKPTRAVGKVTAQLELAGTYQADNQVTEAKRLYEQVQKENPSSEASQLAPAKLQELK